MKLIDSNMIQVEKENISKSSKFKLIKKWDANDENIKSLLGSCVFKQIDSLMITTENMEKYLC